MMDSKSSLKYSPRMESSIGRFLDLLSCILTCPLIVTSSMTVSTYLTLTPDTRSGLRKLCDMALVGPALGFFSLVLLPFAIFGFVLWILVNIFCDSKSYSSVEIPSKENSEQRGEDKYSFATMNILLGQDAIGKFNNCSLVYNRIPKIAAEIRNQEMYYLENLSMSNKKLTKSESVLSEFPRMDFICFQEVFDRIHSLALISMLRKHYGHFIFDIGDNSLGTNCFLLNSGLMIASKYPIMEVKFHPFSWKNSVWQKGVSYGVVTCKLDLGCDNVGLLSNLHTMAYEGPHHLIDAALTEVKDVVNNFRKENVRVTEKLQFDVICGDFNMDNMSPCDIVAGNNSLFTEYRDKAGVKIPGQDQDWAIGTEMRQLTLNTPEMADKESFRRILTDDVTRRHYIIDADVETQTMELMRCDPRPDTRGRVGAVTQGGMRRIDRVLVRTNQGSGGGDTGQSQASIIGYGFVSALASLTDHVPIVLTLNCDSNQK